MARTTDDVAYGNQTDLYDGTRSDLPARDSRSARQHRPI